MSEQQDRINAMRWFDEQPKQVRDMVNEYGFNSVRSLLLQGVNDPTELRELLDYYRQEAKVA